MRVIVVGRQRTLWRIVLWYVLSLGIYRRIWLYKVNKEVDGHAGLGFDHRLTLWLLVLPVIGPSIVTWMTADRLNNYLYTQESLPYGPTWGLWAGTFFLPIIGNAAFMAWTQDRLNLFWEAEKNNRRLAIDIDQGLDKDTRFQKDVKQARARSELAGARETARPTLRQIRDERKAIRALGGSTPALPWRRPHPELARNLHIQCTKCDTRFTTQRDPYQPTPIVCPKCGKSDVLPSLRSNEFTDPEGALITSLKLQCPDCKTSFHAVRDLDGPTKVECPKCGRKDTIPKPRAKAAAKNA